MYEHPYSLMQEQEMGLNLANTNAAIESAIAKAQSLEIAVCIAV